MSTTAPSASHQNTPKSGLVRLVIMLAIASLFVGMSFVVDALFKRSDTPPPSPVTVT